MASKITLNKDEGGRFYILESREDSLVSRVEFSAGFRPEDIHTVTVDRSGAVTIFHAGGWVRVPYLGIEEKLTLVEFVNENQNPQQ